MPTRIPKHGVVNLFNLIKRRWTYLFAVPVFLISPLYFSWNAFADKTLPVGFAWQMLLLQPFVDAMIGDPAGQRGH